MCDITDDTTGMVKDLETGFCTCPDGKWMDRDSGCLDCNYMIPGCTSCTQVSFNTQIPLDYERLTGPDSDPLFLSCDACFENERYVKI